MPIPVARKIKHKDENGVVTEADIGALAENIVTDATHRFVTDAEKTKLAGIADGANKYVHPTTSGNKHIPAGGSSGQILRWSADGTAVWGNDNNTTYSAMKGASATAAGATGLVPAPAAGNQGMFLRGDGTWQSPANTTYGTASQTANGLMSAEDKKKLDGVAAGANNYVHPNSGVTAGTYKSVTVNAQGHITAGTNPTTLAGYGITDAAAKTHNHDGVYLKPTGDSSNTTAAFTAATARANIATGEKLSVIMGKIAKYFADLKAVAFSGKASDITQDATHRFATDTEKATWNGKANTNGSASNMTLTDTTNITGVGTGKSTTVQKIIDKLADWWLQKLTERLVNNGTTTTAGQYALDAAFGKTLADQVSELNAKDVSGKICSDLSYIDSLVQRRIDLTENRDNSSLLQDIEWIVTIKGIRSGCFGFGNISYADVPFEWGYCEFFRHADDFITVQIFAEGNYDIYIRRFIIGKNEWFDDWKVIKPLGTNVVSIARQNIDIGIEFDSLSLTKDTDGKYVLHFYKDGTYITGIKGV